jgi:hypothetical protein
MVADEADPTSSCGGCLAMSEGRRAKIWAGQAMFCFVIAFLTIVLGVLFAVIR